MKKTSLNLSLARIQAKGTITGKERAIIDYYLLNKNNMPTGNAIRHICDTLYLSRSSVYHLIKSLKRKGILKNNRINFERISEYGTQCARIRTNQVNLSKDQFSLQWEKYQKELYHYLLSRHVKSDDAEDIIQDSYLKAWKNISKFKVGSNFRAWIYFITENTMKDFFRKKKPFSYDDNRDSMKQEIENDSVIDKLIESVDNKYLKECVRKLPSCYQEILNLSLHDIPYKEISALLNLPLGTIKSRIHRAKSLLKEISIT
jgi:RNA polymerase sigma-70 factor (ECF subfamily)